MRNGQDVRELLKVRERTHGDSWKLAGRLISQMMSYRNQMEPPELYGMFWQPTFMIVIKLCRALVSPKVADHWIDIQGYAQLVLDSLGGDEDELSSQ